MWVLANWAGMVGTGPMIIMNPGSWRPTLTRATSLDL